MPMIDFDPSPFPDNQLSSHSVVVSSLILFVGVKIRMIAPFDPHMEPCIVPPASPHQIPSRKVLLSLPFVHVKHEEKQLFWHFWDN